jgi:hypothetical protein
MNKSFDLHRRYDLKSRLPGNWVTIKSASQITGMSVMAIHMATNRGKVDVIRAGQGGWSSDRRHHNEVRLESLYDYITAVKSLRWGQARPAARPTARNLGVCRLHRGTQRGQPYS